MRGQPGRFFLRLFELAGREGVVHVDLARHGAADHGVVVVDGQVDDLVEAELVGAFEGGFFTERMKSFCAHLGQLVGAVDDDVLRVGPLVAELLDHVPRQREGGVVLQHARQVGHRVFEL